MKETNQQIKSRPVCTQRGGTWIRPERPGHSLHLPAIKEAEVWVQKWRLGFTDFEFHVDSPGKIFLHTRYAQVRRLEAKRLDEFAHKCTVCKI